jgi:hypothetical protein
MLKGEREGGGLPLASSLLASLLSAPLCPLLLQPLSLSSLSSGLRSYGHIVGDDLGSMGGGGGLSGAFLRCSEYPCSMVVHACKEHHSKDKCKDAILAA